MNSLKISGIALALLSSYSSHSVTISLEQSNTMFSGGEFLISCQEGLRCKLDLGANITSLSNESFEQLDNPKVVGTAKYQTASGAEETCNFLENITLKLGASYETQEINPVYCPTFAPKHTLIGLDIFKNETIYIDSSRKNITIGYEPSVDTELQTFRTDSVGHIIIPIGFKRDSITVDAFLDTGAVFSLISNQLIEEYPEVFSVVATSDTGTVDSFGNPIKTQRTIANSYINGFIFISPYLMGIDFTPVQRFMGPEVKAIIGYNLIKEKNWFLDFKNNTWFLE